MYMYVVFVECEGGGGEYEVTINAPNKGLSLCGMKIGGIDE